MNLSDYNNTTVRIFCKNGEPIMGPCEYFPAEYGLIEYDCEEELLQMCGLLIDWNGNGQIDPTDIAISLAIAEEEEMDEDMENRNSFTADAGDNRYSI